MDKRWWIIVIIAIILVIAVCVELVGNPFEKTGQNLKKSSGLANPASVYCIGQGGNLSIREDKDGGQYGVCVLNNRSECEEWRYFNNNGTC